MQWTIDYLEKDDIILVRLLKPVNMEIVKPLLRDMMSSALKYNSRRYLVDHRRVGVEMSVTDLAKVPDIARDLGVDPEGRVVILANPSEPKNNLLTFVKNLLNLASIHIRIYFDKNEAFAWLRSV